MPSYNDLVEEVLSNLQGYTLTPDQVTYLTADMAVGDTSLTVFAVETGLGTGTIEVGDELMNVISYDPDSSVMTLLPKGRGWRGTTPAAHSTGDTVTISPLVPRHRIKAALNDVIVALWPSIWGVGSAEFTYSAGSQAAWEIPAEAEQVLDVRRKDREGNWTRVRGWETVHSSSTTDFPSGVSLRITDSVESGATVQVVYAKRASRLVADSDDLSTTGLSESAKDLLIWGAMSRLVPALDAGRLGMQFVPADELDQPRQLGSAMALAREFKSQFEKALEAEQSQLQKKYPARVHFVHSR